MTLAVEGGFGRIGGLITPRKHQPIKQRFFRSIQSPASGRYVLYHAMTLLAKSGYTEAEKTWR